MAAVASPHFSAITGARRSGVSSAGSHRLGGWVRPNIMRAPTASRAFGKPSVADGTVGVVVGDDPAHHPICWRLAVLGGAVLDVVDDLVEPLRLLCGALGKDDQPRMQFGRFREAEEVLSLLVMNTQSSAVTTG
jgi:hypothetical protein